MHNTPVSASTVAPASIVHVPVSSSLTVDTVNPACDVFVPDIVMFLGALCFMDCINWDFPIPGSPINST